MVLMYPKMLRWPVSVLVFMCCAVLPAAAQEVPAAKLLDLKQVHADYETAQSNYERAQLQLGTGSITKTEFGTAESTLLRAEINYQKHLIGVLSESVYLTVEQAVKYAAPDGQPRVGIQIRSVLQGNHEYLDGLDEVFTLSPMVFQPDRVYDVYVSLAELESGMIIGKPYEMHIPSLRSGEVVSLDFDLLTDVDGLQVILAYMGKSESKRIFLEKEAGTAIVSINSPQFSLDADLGGQAIFDLVVERITRKEEIVQLVVINVPRQITYEIYETGTQVRSSQIKFTPNVSSKRLSLRTHLPDRTDDRIVLNESLSFLVAAVPQSQASQIEPGRHYEKGELEEMDVGVIELELFPRGIGSMDVEAPNLYFEISADEAVETEIQVLNDGTIGLSNIRVVSDAPAGWMVSLEPDEIRDLLPGRKQRVRVNLLPPKDVGIGAQELTLSAEALADGKVVESDRKIVRIVIRKEMAVGTIVLLAAMVITIVAAIIIFGVRISRR
jgi:hypothetical protein